MACYFTIDKQKKKAYHFYFGSKLNLFVESRRAPLVNVLYEGDLLACLLLYGCKQVQQASATQKPAYYLLANDYTFNYLVQLLIQYFRMPHLQKNLCARVNKQTKLIFALKQNSSLSLSFFLVKYQTQNKHLTQQKKNKLIN